VIKTYANKSTQLIAKGKQPKRVDKKLVSKALMRLVQIDNAVDITDLRLPSSNYLERLGGDRLGQYSIRVNKQFRICFNFENNNAYDVELTDYH